MYGPKSKKLPPVFLGEVMGAGMDARNAESAMDEKNLSMFCLTLFHELPLFKRDRCIECKDAYRNRVEGCICRGY